MDTLSREGRSERMASVKGKGNKSTELELIALFRIHRIIGWRRGQKLFGRPDFVFRNFRVAVFVDGDFWHGHPQKGRMPKSNVTFWTSKIAANRRRDRIVNANLRANGWTVVRIWESDLKKKPLKVVRRLTTALRGKTNPLGKLSPGR